jgi:hypothetical protein
MPQVIIGAAAPGGIVGSNAKRKTITIRNNSAAAQVVGFDNTDPAGLTLLNCGYIIAAGEWLAFSTFLDGKDIKNPWSAIASAAGAVVVFKEMSED